jgi:hypothetical protein
MGAEIKRVMGFVSLYPSYALYCLISVTLNGFNVPVPEAE